MNMFANIAPIKERALAGHGRACLEAIGYLNMVKTPAYAHNIARRAKCLQREAETAIFALNSARLIDGGTAVGGAGGQATMTPAGWAELGGKPEYIVWEKHVFC